MDSAGTDHAQDAPRAIDWDVLRARATALMQRAYAPYSGYPVGVAGLVDDGRVASRDVTRSTR